MRTIGFNRIKAAAIQVGIIGFGVALCSLAKAQDRRGDRHVFQGRSNTGITRYSQSRDLYPECAKYNQKGIPADVYSACMDAVDAADLVAYKRATPIGCEDGYYAGFSEGLYDGSNMAVQRPSIYEPNLTSQGYAEGQAIAPQYQSSTSAASNAGVEPGNRDGASDVRIAWQNAATGTHQIPGKNKTPRTVTYTDSPLANPYTAVGLPRRTLPEMAMAEQYDPNNLYLYNQNRSRSRLCNIAVNRNFRIGDYYRNDGRYSYDRDRAYDGTAAFNLWIANSIKVDSRDMVSQRRGDRRSGPTRSSLNGNRYSSLVGQTRTSEDQSSGGSTTVTTPPAQPTQPAVVYDLGKIYKETFVSAYSYYADQFYAQGFDDMDDNGATDGWNIGIGVGLEYARQESKVSGFNDTFRKMEQNAYASSYQTHYSVSYDTTFAFHQNNPVLTARLLDVVGEVVDDIIQPGQKIYAIYEVVNAGGKAAVPQVQLQGSGIASSNTTQIAVPAVNVVKVANTSLIGQINPNLGNFADAEILLVVAGADAAPLRKQVVRQVTLESLTSTAIPQSGVAKVTIVVKNQSTKIATPESVRITITDTAGHKIERDLGKLTQAQALSVSDLELQGNDELALLNTQVGVKARVSVGTAIVADSNVVAAQPNTAARWVDVAAIFNARVQDAANAAKANAALEQLIADVTAEIHGDNERGIRAIGNNDYADRRKVGATLMFQIMEQFKKPQSAAAKAKYAELGDKLLKSGVDRGLNAGIHFGKSKGRKQFLSWLGQLDP
ncbi:MAG: hypothetical protein JST80_10065 [Bdellovibrionales bacterium]|nr:hypothetical protein [Bdellovibrionales bacterium]